MYPYVHACFNVLFKLIDNSSSLKKGNYDRDGVWIVFCSASALIEKIYQL